MCHVRPRTVRSLLHRRHLRAARNMPRVVRRPVRFMYLYVTKRGAYPTTVTVRTPTGPLALNVDTPDDVGTVNELFCRRDYGAAADVRTVVDFGSNIGISAAFFLSRHPNVRVWCYEPAPHNVPRLRAQLEHFGERVRIEEVAISTREGTVEFGIEPTGRYGSLWIREGMERVQVQMRSVNAVLEEVLNEVGNIDLLKIDIEGHEPDVVWAISHEHATRIGSIVFEFHEPIVVHPDLFAHSFDGIVNRLDRRPIAAT